MRLDKVLADMGLGTRTELKKAIRKGCVTVNRQVVTDAAFSIREEELPEIAYLGKRVEYHPFEYYMMNKPAGVLTATADRHQQTVLDLMSAERRRDLFPVGRLDKDTEGLLLLTNDGVLAHRLLAPRFHVDKLYEAKICGSLTGDDVRKFREGIRYDENLTAEPAALEILETGGSSSRARITIHEGKFHQVKKMVEALGDGRKVMTLKRLRMGPLVLDPALAPGDARPLTEEERALLYQCAGISYNPKT